MDMLKNGMVNISYKNFILVPVLPYGVGAYEIFQPEKPH